MNGCTVGERVVLVNCDRPLIDSRMLEDGRRLCDAQGFVGTLESRTLTDVEGQPQELYSHDGLIYDRAVLTDAVALTPKEIHEWWGASFTYFMFGNQLMDFIFMKL